MELLALMLGKEILATIAGIITLIVVIIFVPILLPILVLIVLLAVCFGRYKRAKQDVLDARDKVQESSRKLRQAEKGLARALDEAIPQAQREFEDADNSIEILAIELEYARKKAISDAQDRLEKSKANLGGTPELVKSAENELAQLQALRNAPTESGATGKFSVATLLEHARNAKQTIDDSWLDVKIKLAEVKLKNLQDDLYEAARDVDEAADELQLAIAHQSVATQKHEERLENSKRELAEAARELDKAKNHCSKHSKKQRDHLQKAEQEYAADIESLENAQNSVFLLLSNLRNKKAKHDVDLTRDKVQRTSRKLPAIK